MPMCGGTGEQRPAGDEEQDIVKQMKDVVTAKTKKNYAYFEAVAVKTQVVAGTNFFIKVKVGNDEYIHIRVFRPLPHTEESLQLHSVQEQKSASDEIVYF